VSQVFIVLTSLIVMNQYIKTVLTFATLILILSGLYFFSDWFSKTTGYVLGEDEKVNLANCLNNKGVIFYTSNTCPDCDKQLEMFGETAKKIINVFTCISVEDCPNGGVPAWKIGSQTHYGVKQLNELISISGCDVF